MTKPMNIMEIAMKTDGDDLAWKREFDRVEAKQKKREVDGLTNLVPHIRMPKLRPYIPEESSHSEQFNED